MSDQENQLHDHPDQQEYRPLPPALVKYYRFKKALKGPEIGRDENGLMPKRFSKTYFESTCPYCETTAEHEGKKFRYSKVTRRKMLVNGFLMMAVAFVTGIGLLHMFVGLALILVLGYSTASHSERKMYNTLLCRFCGKQFPMDQEEQDQIRREEQEKAKTESQKAAAETDVDPVPPEQETI